MKSAVSRSVVAVTVLAALGSAAACGGGGDGGGAGGERPKASAAASKGPAARLERAALATGDIKGYEVERPKASDAAKPAAARPGQASPAKCAPLAALPEPEARVDRVVTGADGKHHTATDVELAAYAVTDARNTMTDLREATRAVGTTKAVGAAKAAPGAKAAEAAESKGCATFRVGGHRYFGLHPLPAPDKGDEAVSYAYAHREGEFVIREHVTVVRRGGTLMTFAASNLYDPEGVQDDRQAERDGADGGAAMGGGDGGDGGSTPTADENPEVAPEIIDAQLDKL
ncbi:hypothetical protein [Streptomyces sp. A1499]|uniref:hypothetical protein n=1 Tax=Streptomyces sp. A1499 TaxID=2563104 RepID=UPI00144AE8D7|nr:hypothetical protein [Streptomyces sp. A1499]